MEGDTLRYWRWKKNNTLSHMTVSFDRCCRPRNLINSFGTIVVPYFLFLHIWQKLLVSAYNCVLRIEERVEKLEHQYLMPDWPRFRTQNEEASDILGCLISTRGEFNSFFARVEGRDDQCFHTSLDNCLLCKWKQQSHYCSLLSAKAIYTKSRTTKCKSGLGLLCALGLTLLYCLGRTIPKWNIFLIVVFCLFFCDVYTLFQIRWKRSHFTTLRAKRAIAIFLLFFIVPRWRF